MVLSALVPILNTPLTVPWPMCRHASRWF